MGFRKSSFSAQVNCVEVDLSGPTVQVRDSKDPDGPVLSFNQDEWRAFLAGTHNHEFELEQHDSTVD